MLPEGGIHAFWKMFTMSTLVFLLIGISCAVGQGLNCGDLGNKPRCECFQATKLAVCRGKIKSVPIFGEYFMTNLNWIDLRFNRIKYINHRRKNEFASVKLDLRKNPIVCDALPKWDNILSECQEETTTETSTIQSTATVSVSDTTTSIVFSSTQSSLTTADSIDFHEDTQFWVSVTVTPSIILYCVGTLLYCLRRRLLQCIQFIRRMWQNNIGTDLEMQPLNQHDIVYDTSGNTR